MTNPNGSNGVEPGIAALQAFIESTRPPRKTVSPKPPSNSTFEPHHHLALQIAHNLRFQHNWTDLHVHYHMEGAAGKAVPRPIVSGLPPQRLYIHPDEQIEILQRQRNAGKAGWPDLEREREWVLPSHLREAWSLARLATIFDTLPVIPPDQSRGFLSRQAPWIQEGQTLESQQRSRPRSGASDRSTPTGDQAENPWRTKQPKRLLLATLEDDSTLVYYIIHDGLVKPRQN